ncbi:MAG: hypothetical protein EA369_01145 [Bradymonadales bacterium]|nr:MAG: hypothetical protein EA369_01145 [Bradymonadales bacterium]
MTRENTAIAKKLEGYFDEAESGSEKRPSIFLNLYLVALMSFAVTATKIALWATRKVNRIEKSLQNS